MLIDNHITLRFEDDHGEERFHMFKIDCTFIILPKAMKRKAINTDTLYLENFELTHTKINLAV